MVQFKGSDLKAVHLDAESAALIRESFAEVDNVNGAVAESAMSAEAKFKADNAAGDYTLTHDEHVFILNMLAQRSFKKPQWPAAVKTQAALRASLNRYYQGA